MRVPLLVVAVAFGAGIACGWWLRPSWPALAIPAAILGSFLYMARRRPAAASMLLLGWVIWLGAMAAGVDARTPADSVERRLTETPRPIVCEGRLIGDIEWKRPPHGPAYRRGWLAVSRLRSPQGWRLASGRLFLRLPAMGTPFVYGDRVRLHGTARGPQRSGRSFDEARWLWIHRAAGRMTVSDPEGLLRLESPQTPWVRYRRWIASFRSRSEGMARSFLRAEGAAYFEGLLLGSRGEFPASLWEAFRKTGTVHVLVVSGLHVGLIGTAGGILLSSLRIRRAWRYLMLAGILVVYCTLTGANPPILRSTIGGVLLCAAAARGRQGSSLNALGAAALLILALDPRALGDASFQLSFAATLGLLVLTPLLAGPPAARPAPRRWLRQGIAASCAAWIPIVPVLAWHFHQVTLLAIPANLVIVPLASFLIVNGLILWAAGLLCPAAAAPAAESFQLLSQVLSWLVSRLAKLPGSWGWG